MTPRAPYIPTDDQLAQVVKRIHSDSAQGGVGLAAYNKKRPDGWACAQSIAKTRGEPWASIVVRLTGLETQNYSHIASTLDIPVPLDLIRERSEEQQARDRLAGMTCKPVPNPVRRVWDWRRKLYRSVPIRNEEWYAVT